MKKNDKIFEAMLNLLDEWGTAHARGEYSSAEWKLNRRAYNAAIRKLKTLSSKLTTV